MPNIFEIQYTLIASSSWRILYFKIHFLNHKNTLIRHNTIILMSFNFVSLHSRPHLNTRNCIRARIINFLITGDSTKNSIQSRIRHVEHPLVRELLPLLAPSITKCWFLDSYVLLRVMSYTTVSSSATLAPTHTYTIHTLTRIQPSQICYARIM